jgi:hypothetical protein
MNTIFSSKQLLFAKKKSKHLLLKYHMVSEMKICVQTHTLIINKCIENIEDLLTKFMHIFTKYSYFK